MAHRLSCSAARGIFPDQGSNPCPLHWQADSQQLCHQGSPSLAFLLWSLWNPGVGAVPQGLSLLRAVPSGLTCPPPRARGPVCLAAHWASRPGCRRGPGSHPLSLQCPPAGLHLPTALSVHVGPAVSRPCGGAAGPCSSEEQREAVWRSWAVALNGPDRQDPEAEGLLDETLARARRRRHGPRPALE